MPGTEAATRGGDTAPRAQRIPRVSLGMPLYNAERYLSKAFDALLAQDYDDFEIIVCDNASTDATWEICKQYAGKDRRIRLHRNEQNMGAAYNYNRTVELARGELFRWVAYDDLCASSLIRRCVEELDASEPDVVLAYPRTVLIDDNGDEIGAYFDGLDLRSSRPYRRLALFAKNRSLCNAAFGVIKLDRLRETGLIRPYISSDIVLLAELAALGKLHEVPERLFYRRIHEKSSRQGATTSLEIVAQWFDPRSKAQLRRPHVGYRIAAAIMKTAIPFHQRLGATAAFLTVWLARRAHIRGSHLKQGFLRKLPRLQTNAHMASNHARYRLDHRP